MHTGNSNVGRTMNGHVMHCWNREEGETHPINNTCISEGFREGAAFEMTLEG